MAEYIGSNDDASNLGLYAGVGGVAFLGGAALAYRATSPIYKNGKGKAKGAEVAEAVVDNAKTTKTSKPIVKGSPMLSGIKDVALGSLSSLTESVSQRKPTLSARAKRGMDTIAQSGIDKYMGGVNDDLMGVLDGAVSNDSYKASTKSMTNDVKELRKIVGDSPEMAPERANAIAKEFRNANPDSLVYSKDVQNIAYKNKYGHGGPATVQERRAMEIGEYQAKQEARVLQASKMREEKKAKQAAEPPRKPKGVVDMDRGSIRRPRIKGSTAAALAFVSRFGR